jgi:hypothetical protein
MKFLETPPVGCADLRSIVSPPLHAPFSLDVFSRRWQPKSHFETFVTQNEKQFKLGCFRQDTSRILDPSCGIVPRSSLIAGVEEVDQAIFVGDGQ